MKKRRWVIAHQVLSQEEEYVALTIVNVLENRLLMTQSKNFLETRGFCDFS